VLFHRPADTSGRHAMQTLLQHGADHNLMSRAKVVLWNEHHFSSQLMIATIGYEMGDE
jgi:hypothetical protein